MKYKVQRTIENYQELNHWGYKLGIKQSRANTFFRKDGWLCYNQGENDLFGAYDSEKFKDLSNYQTLPFEEFKSRFMTEKKYTVDYCKNNPVGICINHHDQLEGLLKSEAIKHIPYSWKITRTPYYIIPHSEKCAPYKDWHGIADYKKKRVLHELIDFQTFIEHNKEKMEESKEIRGYKLKEEYKHLKEAAATILSPGSVIYTLNRFDNNLSTHGIMFSSDVPWEESLKKAGVLDIWFEPVYKESEKTLTLSNGKTVVVGKNKIVAEGKTLNKHSLEWLLITQLTTKVGEWGVELKDATYKIGCWENVKLADIKLIISEYEKLNS